MESKTDQKYLVVTCVFAALIYAITILALLFRTGHAVPFVRFWSVIPFAFYGALAIQNAFKYGDGSQRDLPHARARWIGDATHGVTGITLIVWTLVAALITHKIKKRRYPEKLDWSGRRLSVGLFYLALIDSIFIAAMAVAVGFNSTFTPWRFRTCNSHSYSGDDLFHAQGGSYTTVCQRSLLIQIAAMLNIFVLGLQTIVILPLSAEPRTIRAPLLLIARSVDWLLSSRRHANGWQDLEKAALNTERVKGTMPTLQSLFQEEGIAASLASNLHYIDVTNVALASKATHRSVFNPVGTDASARHEQLCEKACAGTWKLECWACTRVICKGCRSRVTSVGRPRTQAHIDSCYAVCTKCYLIRAPAHPAPFQAAWNSKNLAVQHAGCGHQKKEVLGEPVDLCQSCCKLPSEGIMRVREEREISSLKRLLDIRLRCKECEKSLPRGSRRWWICGEGGHDCHWAGHEVGR